MMGAALRILRWVLTLALAVLVIGLGFGAYVALRYATSQPRLAGAVALKDAPGKVTILRDANGVPHIYGDSQAAAYYGMGFAQAQDRFFFMDLARRAVRGKLSELVGEIAYPVDANARAMNWGAVIEAQAESLPPELRRELAAYVAGVNAALKTGPIAPEYALLFARPEPWTIEDSLACGQALVIDQVVGLREDLNAQRLKSVLEPAQFAEFYPPYPAWGPLTIPAAANPAANGAGRPGVVQAGVNPGSNSWAVAGARSATGKPLLAGDPHVGLGAPATFYLAHLHSPAGDVVGAALPGTPLIVMGHGPHAAWAVTNGEVDTLDAVPLTPAQLASAKPREETIRIRTLFGMKTKHLKVLDSEEGPVATSEWARWTRLYPGQSIAVKSAAADRANRPYDAMLTMEYAKSAEDVRKAAQILRAPALNFTIALDNGEIGYALTGALPARDRNGKWVGELAESDRPVYLNPAAGFIVNANNRHSANDRIVGPFLPFRAARIETLLAARDKHDLDSFAAIQRDVTPLANLHILPAIARATPATDAGKALQKRLGAWDGAMRAEATEPLEFAIFYRALANALYGDELKTDQIDDINEAFIDNVAAGQDAQWCDDIRTPAVESCADIFGRALDQAAAVAIAPGMNWGKAHILRFAHPLLSKLPILGPRYTVEQKVAGSGDAPFATHYYAAGADPLDFHGDFGPGFRGVYDLADLNRSRFVIAPGESGHVFSPFYRNLAPLWAKGEGVEIRTDLNPDAPPAGVKTLRLTPKG